MSRVPKDSTSTNSSNSNNNNDNSDNNTYTANGRAFVASTNSYTPPPSLPQPIHNYYPSVGENGAVRRSKGKHPQLGSPMDPSGAQLLSGNNPGVPLPPQQHVQQDPHLQYMGSKYAPNLPPRYSPPSGEGETGDVPEDPPYYVQDLSRTRTLDYHSILFCS
ncbi:optomotor-blind protein-like [Hyalella azteca]|uniref:Optomotor-blind protein-like n=1 Tax=Hyalella azteca TaxID=294128 RepID=A0A8B7P1C9_HYAAZ|nr:optomotor-blind protein-like [Hyalella azteca]